MSIPVVIFTHEPDGPLALLAGRSAVHNGLGPVYLIEDKKSPSNGQVALKIKSEGFNRVVTDFPRNGNLNGIKCITGMMQTYKRVMDRENSDYIIKLDADTLVNGSSIFKELAAQKVLIAGMRVPFGEPLERPLYGASQLISRDLVHGFLDFVARWGGIPGEKSDTVAEDIGVGVFAKGLDSKRCAILPFNKEGGIGAGWVHGRSYSWFDYYKERYEYITFGNLKDQHGYSVSRTTVYMTMLDFCRHTNII